VPGKDGHGVAEEQALPCPAPEAAGFHVTVSK